MWPLRMPSHGKFAWARTTFAPIYKGFPGLITSNLGATLEIFWLYSLAVAVSGALLTYRSGVGFSNVWVLPIANIFCLWMNWNGTPLTFPQPEVHLHTPPLKLTPVLYDTSENGAIDRYSHFSNSLLSLEDSEEGAVLGTRVKVVIDRNVISEMLWYHQFTGV